MTIRISGLYSGLDTDSMVEDLVKVASTKLESLEKEQTRLEWKQDAWESLNTKINTFFKSYLSNLRYDSSFNKRATTISNSSVATVVAGDSAVNGTQTLSVQSLAKAGYLTGGKLTEDTSGNTVTGKTTLASLGISDGSSVNVTVDGETQTLTFNGSTTINQVVSSLNSAGVNASWDNTNKRLFINVEDSGADNDFDLTAVNSEGQTLLSNLKLVDSAEADTYAGVVSGTDEYNALLETEKSNLVTKYTNLLSSNESTISSLESSLASVTSSKDSTVASMKEKYADTTDFDLSDLDDASTIDTAISDVQSLIDTRQAELEAEGKTEEEIAADETMVSLNSELSDITATKSYYTQIDNYNTAISDAEADSVTYQSYIDDDGGILTAEATSLLDAKIAAADAGTYADTDEETKAVRVYGTDAQITLNGAVFTSSTNSFTVNGLTITAMETTDDGEEVTLNTDVDTSGIYDMIKSFFSEYNSLINEMTELYNADDASDYDPLTDDEKDSMSDTEVELWEEKIKDGILSGDTNLSSVMNIFKTGMLEGVTIDGTTYNLSSFGIETESYFTALEDERNAYHIDGDEDDSVTSGETDKLKTAIATDPDTVRDFFTEIATNIYDDLNKFMRSSTTRSIYHAYDDKTLDNDYDDLSDEIDEQQDKIDALEEYYYDKFSAMETALASLEDNSSAVTALLSL